MKHLAWIFIAIFCTALAQVKPAELLNTKQEVCGCCDNAGDCGMPDCALPAAPAQQALARNVTTVVQVATKRAAATARVSREKFYTQFVSRPAAVPDFRAPLVAAAAANVPLFKAHCSFLI